jgi:hypothetical protein
MEEASALWPPTLRRRLNSALDHHERSRSQASPFRSMFFRPGLKYINSFEFRGLGAANEPEQPISGALSTARTLSASKSNRLPRTRGRRDRPLEILPSLHVTDTQPRFPSPSPHLDELQPPRLAP